MAKSFKESTTKQGAAFEAKVASVYELLGYQVQSNVTSAGAKQTDLRVSRTVPGALPITLYVECKAFRSKPLPAGVVRQFLYDYAAICKKQPLTGGVLVSEGRVSRQARDAITDPSCCLMTYSELEREVLNAHTALRRYISWYEEQDIFLSYLPLSCETQAGTQPLMKDVRDWLFTRGRLYVILGDFGTGKTTFLQRFKYELALNASSEEPIPILVPLRNYEKSRSLEDFIENHVQNELGVRLPYSRISPLLKSGRILLLLDGFDEMAQKVDADIRRSQFKALLPLIIDSAKTIITCRPAYFVTDAELGDVFGQHIGLLSSGRGTPLRGNLRKSFEKFLLATQALSPVSSLFSPPPDLRVARVNELTRGAIDKYVRAYQTRESRAGRNIAGMRERIRATYNLEDLAKRPVLLNLIVRTLPSLDQNKEASPSVIYLAYTENWMNHDYAKGEVRWLIPAPKKRRFMEELAWQMHRENVLELPSEDLIPKVQRFFKRQELLAFLATDIQACSFLQRDTSGRFRFSHASFMEYFAASYCRDALSRGEEDVLTETDLTPAIYYFLGDMVYTDFDFEQQLTSITTSQFRATTKLRSLSRLESTLLLIYPHSRRPFPLKKIVGLRWVDIAFRRNTFNIEFSQSDLRTLTFDACVFRRLLILDSRAVGCEIHGGKIELAVFRIVSRLAAVVALRNRRVQRVSDATDERGAPDVTLKGTQIRRIAVQGNSFVTFDDCTIDRLDCRTGSGRVFLEMGAVNGGSVEYRGPRINLSSTKVSNVTFDGGDCSAPSIHEFIASIRRYWDGQLSRHSHRWRDSIFRRCVFARWDFTQVDLGGSVFIDCVFVACRFPQDRLVGILSSAAAKFTRSRFAGLTVPPLPPPPPGRATKSAQRDESLKQEKRLKLAASNEFLDCLERAATSSDLGDHALRDLPTEAPIFAKSMVDGFWNKELDTEMTSFLTFLGRAAYPGSVS